MLGNAQLYSAEDLLDRLTDGVANQSKPVTFIVGSAISVQKKEGREIGVPDVGGVIEIIRSRFSTDRQKELDQALSESANPYQDAFHFLLGKRGQSEANAVIKEAVARARLQTKRPEHQAVYEFKASMSETACDGFDKDNSGWELTDGLKALGSIAAGKPDLFGKKIVTTNFDPLISVAIERAQGYCYRSFYHRDGNLSLIGGNGTHVAHLHGYWHGSDTLHTPRQLIQSRTQLRASLCQVMRESICVFLGYGGWDDALTASLSDVISDDSSYPEIIWCTYEREPEIRQPLVELLTPGIDRGRVGVYSGIDCHEFLPKLAEHFGVSSQQPMIPLGEGLTEEPPLVDSVTIRNERRLRKLKKLSDDTPPRIDFFVGREADIQSLSDSEFRVGFVTGMGGQGKSALAAKFYASEIASERHDVRIWKDCREQSARFADHLISLVEALNDGRVSASELARQDDDSLVQLFCDLTVDLPIFIVLDNIDHFVDLENHSLVGLADRFVRNIIQSKSKACVLFTCRPQILYDSTDVYSLHLEGLSLESAFELFEKRNAPADRDEIIEAHDETRGHAFWLDLLAAQLAKRSPAIKLNQLLQGGEETEGGLSDWTLRAIWESLREREQIALQAFAETVRPTSLSELSDYLGNRLRFNQLSKAVRYLRDLNLLVIKDHESKEVFELHPLVRSFIVKTFKREQRQPYIEAILTGYELIFAAYNSLMPKTARADELQKWLEGIEILLNGRKFTTALEKLSIVRARVRTQEPPFEFVHLCHRLFTEADFQELVIAIEFENLFEDYVEMLVNAGMVEEANTALEDYHETLEGKDARYIHYCEMQCYLHWRIEEFDVAIKWGKRGVALKDGSQVDTSFDAGHDLALAQRDSGDIEPALKYFLGDAKIEDVTTDGNPAPDRDEAFYGNIGRCLQLMGQVDTAASCYRKSGLVLDKDSATASVENEAYLREWVAFLMLTKGDEILAEKFFLAAWMKWTIVSPPKAKLLESRAAKALLKEVEFEPSNASSAERAFRNWLKGK